LSPAEAGWVLAEISDSRAAAPTFLCAQTRVEIRQFGNSAVRQ
jgi:hypothetical protein